MVLVSSFLAAEKGRGFVLNLCSGFSTSFCVLYCSLPAREGSLPDFVQTSYEWVVGLSSLSPLFGRSSGEAKRETVLDVRNNFSYAEIRNEFPMMYQKKMVVRKLKICKFGLVSKICYFFGSLSCVSCFRRLVDWLEEEHVLAGAESYFCVPKLDGFSLPLDWLVGFNGVTSPLNLVRFSFDFPGGRITRF